MKPHPKSSWSSRSLWYCITFSNSACRTEHSFSTVRAYFASMRRRSSSTFVQAARLHQITMVPRFQIPTHPAPPFAHHHSLPKGKRNFYNAGHGTAHIRIMTITIQAGNQWLRLKPDSQNDEFTPSSAVWAGDCPVVRMVDLLLCNGGNLMAAFVPHIYDMSGSPDFWTVSLIERKVAAPLRIVENPINV